MEKREKDKIKLRSRWFVFSDISSILGILAAGFLVRIILSPFGTLSLDFNTFVAWSHILVEGGLDNFYNSWSDYLPGYLYVLFLLGKLNSSLNLQEPFLITLYKLPAILADVGTGFLIYKIVSKQSIKLGLIGALAYLGNPAIIINSSLWGQVDGLIPFFVLLSFILLQKNVYLAAVAIAIGALIKPQAGFAAPFFAFLLFRSQGLIKSLTYAFFSFIVFVLGFLPFSQGENVFEFIAKRLDLSANQYPYTSVNAFNIWSTVTEMWKSDQGIYLVGISLVGIIYLISFLKSKIENDQRILFYSISLLFAGTFLFLTRIHERHLLPVFAPLVVYATLIPTAWVSYILFSCVYIANLMFSYIWITEEFRAIFSREFIIFLSLINLLSFGILLLSPLKKVQIIFKDLFEKLKHLLFINREEGNTVKKVPHATKILFGILLFAALTRVINLWNPQEFYFDEVYHAYTASEILKGNPQAWEYWADPPEGVAYEWTHPPMAKLFMAASMFIFGENSFSWRLPSVILSLVNIYFIFVLIKTLLKDERAAIFTSGLFALDGLNFSLSRIGMNDTYFLFFLLGTLVFFLNKRLFLSALFLGGAFASKWTSFFILPILFIAWILYTDFSNKENQDYRKKIELGLAWFFVIPPLVYFLSYLIFITSGHTLLEWWQTQQQMWWYHTQLVATHPYTSPWWSWPIMLKPIWVYTAGVGNSANLYIAGNPLIFYSSLAAIIVSILLFIKTRSRGLLVLLVAYFGLFLPWSISPRIMFLYHYLPATPFMIGLLGFVLSRFWELKNKKFVLLFLTASVLFFLFYYPLWSGVSLPFNWKVRF